MPTFLIEQYEIHIQEYEVESQSEAEAIAKLLNGDAEPVDDSLEYVEVCEDRGLPVDEYRELAEELQSLGVSMDEHVIPSIRSIVKVE